MTNPSEPKLRTLSLSPRLGFAALLWLGALIAPGLYAMHLASPVQAVESSHYAGLLLTRAFYFGCLLLIVGALLYPPFLPSTRLAIRKIRDRLSVDQGPMYRALEELRHLETAANHVVVARNMRNMGNLRAAIGHVVRAVELEPDGIAARFLLGIVLRESGQPQAAAEQLAGVVEREPDHAFGEARVQLGLSLLQAGREADALLVLKKHAEDFGGSRKTRYWMARAHKALGQPEEARQALREAAEPPGEGERFTPEDQLYRARARVKLWFSGGSR